MSACRFESVEFASEGACDVGLSSLVDSGSIEFSFKRPRIVSSSAACASRGVPALATEAVAPVLVAIVFYLRRFAGPAFERLGPGWSPAPEGSF